MSYITQQDLEDELGLDRLIQLTAKRGATEPDAERVAKAIAFAVGTFDAYARTRYTIPVPATVKVKATCLDLAIYNLERGRSTTSETADKIRKERYDPSIKFLEALQSGKAALDVPTAEETTINPGSPDSVLKGNSNPIFTDTKLGSY